jgi:propionyl-CoA carboxylase alpha chain
MIKAIEEYQVEGVQTTLPFGKFLNMRRFVPGNLTFCEELLHAMFKNKWRKKPKSAVKVALKQYFEDQKIVRLLN